MIQKLNFVVFVVFEFIEQTVEIFRGTWPTTESPFIMATAKGS